MSTAAALAGPLDPSPAANSRASLSQAPVSAATTLHVAPATVEVELRRERIELDGRFTLSDPLGYFDRSSRTARLRRSNRRPHDQLLVEFAGRDVLTELTAAGRVVFSDLWTWQATIDGRPLAAAGPWKEVCWHTNAEVDYLEIELPLAEGWLLERQFVLGRKDRFVLVGDALLHSSPHAPREVPISRSEMPTMSNHSPEIRYASTIPLAGGVRFAHERETHEGRLTAGRQQVATLLPLALPEWRAEHCHGDLTCGSDNALMLMQAAQGHALYAPLWIDLAPARTRQPLTWRRLSVGESLKTVPRDRAVGYRVQFGRQNWLIYRTLAPRGNRTVLGQNYCSKFVCCRMLKSGKTESIIEIE